MSLQRYILVLAFLFVSSFAGSTFAAFSLSSGIIDQTGTDTDLSGLSAISGVVTQTNGVGVNEFTTYIIPHSLHINGTLTADLARTNLVFTGNSRAEILKINNGGSLTFEAQNTFGGFTTNLPQGLIMFALDTNSNWNRREINLVGSGQMTLKNITLKGVFSPWLAPNASGLVLFEDVTIDKDGSTGDIQTNVHGNKENVIFRRVKIYADGQSGITFRDNVGGNGTSAVMENVEIYQARDAWNNESGDRLVVRGLVPNLGSTVDVSQWGNRRTKIVNAVDGTQFLWGGHLASNGNNRGSVAVFQELEFNVFDAFQNPIDQAQIYLKDNPIVGASNHTIPEDGLAANVQRTYQYTSDASGNIPTFEVLIGDGIRTNGGAQIVGGNDNRIRPRGINTTGAFDATDDLYEFHAYSYEHNIFKSNLTLKGGTNGEQIDATVLMAEDTNISESDKSVVDGYGSIDNLERLYDRSKAWKIDNISLEYPAIDETLVTGSGTEIDLGSRNLVVDGTAASAFDVNTGTDTITINAGTMSCTGDDFTSLVTTGTVTFTNGASPGTCIFTDSVGTNGVLTLTGLDTATVLVYDDDSAGDDTISYQTSQTGDIEIPFSATSSTDFQVVVRRQGFSEENFSFDPSSGGFFEFPIAQFRSLTIEGTPIYQSTGDPAKVTMDYAGRRINIGDFTLGGQELYDTLQDFEVTEDAMKFPRILNFDGDEKALLLNSYQARNRDGGGALPGINAFVFAEVGSILDDSNGSVQFLSDGSVVDRQEQLVKMLEMLQGSSWDEVGEDFNTPDADLVNIAGPGFDPNTDSLAQIIDTMFARGIVDYNTLKDLVE